MILMIFQRFFKEDYSVKQVDLVFSIDPYTYQLTVSGNADRDILSQIEKLLNEGDNAKNMNDTCMDLYA